MKRLLWVGALSCHVAMVIAGAAHFTSRAHGPLARGLRFYDALSGAGDRYSFFAPTVGPQLRARFTLTGERSRFEETLETGKSREVGFRLGNVAGTIYLQASRPDVRRAFLGALAATRFGAHPEVNLVQVNLEEWVMPTMAEYRLGARPEWRWLVDATFVRTAADAIRGHLVSPGVAAPARSPSRRVAAVIAASPHLALRRPSVAAW